MKKQLFFTLALFCSAFMSFGQSFTFNGIQYSFNNTSPETVSVAPNTGTSGNVIIPETVSTDAGNYSVTSIGSSAFYNCANLTSITIPNSITSIGSRAFQRTGLTSVNIPNSVTTIDFSAFRGCTSLTSITIPNSVTSIADYAFSTCEGLTSVDIPDSVTSIGDSAFDSCFNLTFVTIPNNVTSIGPNAFANSGLTSVTIPNSVTSIANSTFAYCYELTSVIIPNSVTSIGNYAFYDCLALTSVIIPNSVTSIGVSAFGYCKGLVSIIIPSSVTSIKNSAFETCIGLTSVTIPSSVISIGNSAFSACSGLTSLTIPNSVTSIGNYAFSRCNGLTSVNIPNSVISIGQSAFSDCIGLTSVIIPNSVLSIGGSAFASCTGLTSVTVNWATSVGFDANIFNSVAVSGVYLFVPINTVGAYQTVAPWNNFNIREQLSLAEQYQNNVPCFGGSIGNASVAAIGGVGPYNYSWSPSGGNDATASNLTAGNYSCTINDFIGNSITKNFTITQPDVISATQSQTNVSCIGSADGTATVIALGGTGSYSYSWFPNDSSGATATGLSAGNYICTIANSDVTLGCPSLTISFVITEPTTTIPTFTQVAPICLGDVLATLPSTSNNAVTGTWSPALDLEVTKIYTFTPNAGQCALSTTLTIVVTPSTTNTTTVSAVGNYIWPVNGETLSTTLIGYEFPNGNCNTEILNLTITPATVIITNENGVLNAVTNAPNATYQWYNCLSEQSIAGQTSATFTPTQSGSYNVIIRINGILSGSAGCFNYSFLANNIFSEIAELDIYPNPSTGIFNLKLPTDLQIEIYNNLGQMLSSEKMFSGSNVINISDKPTGVYFLKANDGDNVSTFKIIKN